MQSRSITILGSTGSIGVSTLAVISEHPDRFDIFALTAHKNVERLAQQCLKFKPKYAVISTERLAETLTRELQGKVETEILCGVEALAKVSSDDKVDMVMAAIVGAAGLRPTLAAVEKGKRVLLANKESLVMGGQFFMNAALENAAELLPIDSEHNAIFQCLPFTDLSEGKRLGELELKDLGVNKIYLTGSGGPFLKHSRESLGSVTPEQACKHPNWDMGKKISVDSATMMNKGLEFIEACYLFNAGVGDIEVLIHPQSIVHSMVAYNDGSVLAQMGCSDMKIPIANCLAWPERIVSKAEHLDFLSLGALNFEAPKRGQFPCLTLAIEVASAGGSFPAALNAVNEVAVEAFLEGKIGFLDLPRICESVLSAWAEPEPKCVSDVIELDALARVRALECIAQ